MSQFPHGEIPIQHRLTGSAARRWGATVAAGAALIVGLTACGASSATKSAAPVAASSSTSQTSPESSTAQPQSAPTIHIDNFAYAVPVSVSPGATVMVMNMDGEAHTVTADSGKAFDVMAVAGRTTTFTAPAKAGSYPFHCTYHSNMHGVLVVK
jgi:plastocyanin